MSKLTFKEAFAQNMLNEHEDNRSMFEIMDNIKLLSDQIKK
jgi:hypothetical protein